MHILLVIAVKCHTYFSTYKINHGMALRASKGYTLKKGGWDIMPGQEKADYLVARACADGLELLIEK